VSGVDRDAARRRGRALQESHGASVLAPEDARLGRQEGLLSIGGKARQVRLAPAAGDAQQA
jgi:hypothetical protein